MCHLYPYKNVKLLWKFFYINDIYVPQFLNATSETDYRRHL